MEDGMIKRTRRSGLMSSVASCTSLDTQSRSAERSPSKVDPHRQYEDMARRYEEPATDSPLPELQPSVRKSAPRPPPEDAEPDRTYDRLIRKAEVQRLIGGVSHMHLKRLVTNPASGFPQPLYQGRFPFWWLNDVLGWINRLGRQPHTRAPQGDSFKHGRQRKPEKARRRAGAGA
jgi:hypothetical protein